MRSLAWRLRYCFASDLQARLSAQREAVRFEAQNFSWTQQELNYHADALIRGLRAVGLQSGDQLMLKISPSLQSEAITSRLAAARIGAEIVRSKAASAQDWTTELQEKKPAGIIFDPTIKLQDGTVAQSLPKVFPGLNRVIPGQPISFSKHSQLKFLIQTGQSTLPGVYKWRNILNYAPNDYNPVEHKPLEATTIPDSDQPIVVLDANCNKAFKAGLANALNKGRFVIYSDKSQVKNILANVPFAQVYSSGQVADLPESATLLVPKSSTINSGHRNRIEV